MAFKYLISCAQRNTSKSVVSPERHLEAGTKTIRSTKRFTQTRAASAYLSVSRILNILLVLSIIFTNTGLAVPGASAAAVNQLPEEDHRRLPDSNLSHRPSHQAAPAAEAVIGKTSLSISKIPKWGEGIWESFKAAIVHHIPLDQFPASQGLRADYYNNNSLTLPITLTRFDDTVDFDWLNGGPDPALGEDLFSVRWSGQLQPEYSETYTFHTLSDDGVRLWVNGELLIDNWTTHGPTWDSGSIDLIAGNWYDLKLEYFEEGGGAQITLAWSSDSFPQEVIPVEHLRYPDFSGSTVEAFPQVVVADGISSSTLSLTLADTDSTPISGKSIYIQMSGSHNLINDAVVADNSLELAGSTDENGALSTSLASTVAETKYVLVLAGDVVVDSTTVTYEIGDQSGFLVLLPGETASPGEDPGKVGSAQQAFIGQETPIKIVAVDSTWNHVSDATGSIEFTSTDPAAVLPDLVDLVGGLASAKVTWTTPGTQTLTITSTADPSLTGSANLEVSDGLVEGLQGEYFNNILLNLPSALTRFDKSIDFAWGINSPAPGVNPDGFSVRWSGLVEAVYNETYTFHTLSDDGVRLWVDEQLLIDNWTDHAPTWDSGTVPLEAGQKYSLRMEYYDADGDATARLEWSSPSTPQAVIPIEQLSFMNLSASTIEVNPSSLIANLENTTTAQVNLETLGSTAIPDASVYLQVSGSHNWINGLAVENDAWVHIGQTDDIGQVTATLASNMAEVKTVRARALGSDLEDPAIVTFSPDEPDSLIILLPGEFHTPGEDPGVSGSPEQIVAAQTVVLNLLVVDQNWNLVDTYDDVINLDTTDLIAELPSTASLVGGHASLSATWMTPGTQTLYVTSDTDPLLTDEVTFEVFAVPTLIVGDGETVTIDDVRYPMAEFVEAGESYLPYDGTPGIESGDELLIIVMQGESMGVSETVTVDEIYGDILYLDDDLINAYDGVMGRVMVQRVPHYGQVTIQDGGILTAHAWDEATGGVLFLRAENLTVESGGRISVDELGFRAGEGPGSGGFHAGGGYGGYGGNYPYHEGNGGVGYGSALEPNMLGSAGGNASETETEGANAGGPGGGVLWLEVTDTLQIEGYLTANGSSRMTWASWSPIGGGGSGGSIRLTAGTLTGAGSIWAYGGSSYTTDFEFVDYYGGGSGGRIAASFTENTFTGAWRATGGNHGGSPGTIFLHDETTSHRKLLIDYCWQECRPAILTDPQPTNWAFDQIELTRNADLELLDPDDTLELTESNMAGDGTGQIHLHYPYAFELPELRYLGLYIAGDASLTLPSAFTVRGAELSVYGNLSGLNDLTLTPDGEIPGIARLAATGHSQGEPVGTFTLNSVVVNDGAVLELASDAEAERGLTLLADTIMIDTGGQVSGDGLGYQPDGYRGPGTSIGSLPSGAGHGGFGGGSDGGSPYGSALEPATLGSAAGGAGGSAIHMLVNSLHIDGVLSANGMIPPHGGGGGAGGSLWLDVQTVSGAGTIRANGGHHYTYQSISGSGGGGRIALAYETNSFSGAVQAAAGPEKNIGGPGTIVLVDKSSGYRRLLVDNLEQVGRQAGLTDPAPAVWTFDKIELVGNGHLELLDPDDTIILTAENMAGDGTAQLLIHHDLTYDEPELSGFGFHVPNEITLSLPADFTIRGVRLTSNGTFDGVSNLTLAPDTFSNSLLHLEAAGNSTGQPIGTYNFDSITVEAKQILELASDPSSDLGVTLYAANMTVGGHLSADGLGYTPDQNGPGAPTDSSSGAGHGGLGGGPGGGLIYGNYQEPTTLGSAGAETEGGNGAGAIRFILTGTLDIPAGGAISANGDPPRTAYNFGGGAGGSLWITAQSVTGGGSIEANGGDGSTYGTNGGGGGGRIALYADSLDPAITFSVEGGQENYDGSPGTVYVGLVDPLLSTLTIEPTSVVADGVSTATITVALKNSAGDPMPDQPVEVGLVSGKNVFINDQAVSFGNSLYIGLTDLNGIATASISAEKTGSRTIQAQSGNVLIAQQAEVEFILGPIDPSVSLVEASTNKAPADGSWPVWIYVTVLDALENPIPGVTVVLAATGNAVLIQPTEPTNSAGRATGGLTDATAETVTVTATADGIPLDDEALIEFRDTADLTVGLIAPTEVAPGWDLTYDVILRNIDLMTATDISLTLALAPELEFLSHTAPVDPTQDGNTLTWNLADLAFAVTISFKVTTHVSESTVSGKTLTSTLTASSSTPDSNPTNNTTSETTTALIKYEFQAQLKPTTATLNAGGSAIYTLTLRNTGFFADTYTLSVSGLDPSWVNLNQNLVSLAPGGFGEATLTVEPDGCQAEATLPFNVEVESSVGGEIASLSAQLSLVQAPQITIDSPKEGTTTGSKSVLFGWRTKPETTGTLSLYNINTPDEKQVFTKASGTTHAVQVEDLIRYETYEWFIEADSACGTATSGPHIFTVGSGIVFVNKNPSFVINRDYDQIIQIVVRNEDELPHTLLATIQNPYEDLIINFVGSGSVDETVSLGSGESRILDLVVHAQDATAKEYDLVAEITADEGAGTPLIDTTTIHLTVLSEADFSVTEIEVDPVTGTRTFQITNSGQPLTDISIKAIDPSTGFPARVYMTPTISHALLGTDQSITFRVIPLFDESDLPESSSSAGNLASVSVDLSASSSPAGILPADLIVKGAGVSKTFSTELGCPTGNVHAVTLKNVCMKLANGDWYCTNRPEISVPFTMPYFVGADDVSSIDLHVTMDSKSNVLPHTTSYALNGQPVGTLENIVPDGTYSTKVPTSALNTGGFGPVIQNLDLTSEHENGGHYIVATDFVLGIGMDQVTTYVCATSPEQAQEVAMEVYGFESISSSSACAVVAIQEEMVWSSCGSELCFPYSSTQVTEGNPINTNTGGMDYSIADLSISTSAGPLTFQRWYSSLATEAYTDALGYGWTHSLDTRLIFPDDPGGREGVVLFKAHSANRYEFTIEEDGTFTPFPGMSGSLSKEDGPPVTYTYVDSAQRVYTFDSTGRLTTLTDPHGHAHHYTYDVQGRLVFVSDDTGERTLTLSYDAQGRIESVSDHSGRQVTYAYDLAGDLTVVTDVLGQSWTYSYDPTNPHHLSEIVDPGGITIERTEYNSQGRAVRQYNGEGELVVELEYDGFGTAKVYDGLGNEAIHTYNNSNAIQSQTDALGGKDHRDYDPNFRPTSITDVVGDTTQLTWSDDGANLTQVIDAEGNQTDLAYDELNNLTEIIDPRGFSTAYTYDGTLLTTTADALGNTTTYTYTPEGYLASVTDAHVNTTSYTYDAFGQRTSMTDALGNTWTYSYDDLGRLVDMTDPLGRINHNEYDAAGRLIKATRNYDSARPKNDESQFNIVTEYIYDQAGNQTQVIDTFGRVTQSVYDDANRIIQTIDPGGNVSTSTYDEAGNLIASTDTLGRTTTYTYDQLNRLVATTDPMGSTTTTTYNPDGTVASTTDALGHTTSYTYDDLKRLVATSDALGNTTSSTYDKAGNLVASTDALGNTTTYEYDALNRLIRQVDPSGGVTEHVYDKVGNRVQTIDPNGHTTIYIYDALNRLVTVTDALGNPTTYAYDAVGNRVSTTDANGHTAQYIYDQLDRLVETIDPMGNGSETVYDALGNVTAQIDPNGNTTAFEYDVLNRLTLQTVPLGGTTSYAYDAVGNQLTRTDANGHTTTTSYDKLNRPVSVTDPNGHTTATTYDAVGNVVSTTDPSGNVTTFGYDPLNRQISVTDPLGNTSHYSYDSVGNRVSTTDANGVVTRYEFDALSRLTVVIENHVPSADPGQDTNVRTEYTYDAVGNRLTIRDGRGNLTTFDYDWVNRLLSEADPLGNTTSYAYDPVGNRTALTDAEGFTTTFTYDPANHLIAIDYPEPDADVAFTYDASGNCLTMIDGVGTTIWAYDALNRPIFVTDPFGDTVGYEYDAVGNRTLLAYPDGKSVSYTYDQANRKAEVWDWDGQLTEYTYDSAGRLKNVSLPNGVTSTYNYDAAGQLLSLEHATATKTISSFHYAYGVVGDRVQAVETMLWPSKPVAYLSPSAATSTATTGRVAFDPTMAIMAPLVLLVTLPLSRRRRGRTLPMALIVIVLVAGLGMGLAACTLPIPTPPPTATPTPTSTPTPTATSTITPLPTSTNTPTPSPSPTPTPVTTTTTIDYSYDPLYRLIAADYSTGEYFHYTYDEVGNRLTQETHEETNTYLYDPANRLTEVDGVPYVWSANGNLLNDGERSYTYDHANRLSSVVMGADIYSFAYNGLGDRLQQSLNGETTSYTLDLNNGLTQVLSDGPNSYLFGASRIGEQAGGEWSYHVGDALGSVRQLVNAAGEISFARTYEPFGSPLLTSGSGATSYGFTGEWTDATGLIFFRMRYLNPISGRFVTSDPGSLERSFYLYADANPVTNLDPSGLFTLGQILDSFNVQTTEQLLGLFENRTAGLLGFQARHPRWGWLAALLDARPGDSITLYNVDIPYSSADPYRRELAQLQMSYDTERGILANGFPMLAFLTILDNFYPYREQGNPFWRDETARYYLLQGSALGFYTDGSRDIDYPDFRIITISDAGLISYLAEKFCDLKGKIGLGASYAHIIDRFGNQYDSVTFGLGFGVSAISYGEGFLVPNAVGAIIHGERPLIMTSQEMIDTIEGLGIGPSIALAAGVSAERSGWWGSKSGQGALVYSSGAQIDLTPLAVSIVIHTSTTSSKGWNWAIEDQLGETPWINAVFRHDIENKLQSP